MESQGQAESSPSQRGQEDESGCLPGRLGTLTSKYSAEVTADALVLYNAVRDGGAQRGQGEPMMQRKGWRSPCYVTGILTHQLPPCTAYCDAFSSPDAHILRFHG